MSTYVYVTCLDHDPVLQAEEESGQHLYDLPQIRKDIADRDVLVRLLNESDSFFDLGYFRNHTVRFLAAHPKCQIGIRDEYGVEHPVSEDQSAECVAGDEGGRA